MSHYRCVPGNKPALRVFRNPALCKPLTKLNHNFDFKAFDVAHLSILLVDLLRQTARALESSHDYQWGHVGSCNCGFLAQQMSALQKSEIHAYAMQRHGD